MSRARRESLEKGTDQLRQTAQDNKGNVVAWWKGVQQDWDAQVGSIRREIESKKTEHDLKSAQRKAESAEEDAEFAVSYAYWAVEEAEYAVLDATLARMDADSLAESRA